MTQGNARSQGIRRTLIVTLLANIGVAAAKVIIGVVTGSLAMVSDGIHSSMDATSNIVGLISTAIAARPPDDDHPYGHRRFESLASLFIGGILILTAWEIIQSSISRLTQGNAPDVTPLSFVVMIVTIIINISVWWYERRMGRKLNAEILLTSEHTLSDVFVSLTVLASLIAVQLGIGWLDAVAALFVVVLIGVAAVRIVLRSSKVLVDRAPLDSDPITAIVESVAGIQSVQQVRSRGSLDDVHLDVAVQVAAPMTADHSAALTREIRQRLRSEFDGLRDIQVMFVPQRDGPPDLALIARAEADALGLGVHEVIPSTVDGGLMIEMHVEVPAEQTVGEAHTQVTRFEARLRERIPSLTRVVTHIEPAHTHEDALLYGDQAHYLADRTLLLAADIYPAAYWHDLSIRAETDGGYAISLHCHVKEDMPVQEAHRIAEMVETRIRAEYPTIHRITIHTEPDPAHD